MRTAGVAMVVAAVTLWPRPGNATATVATAAVLGGEAHAFAWDPTHANTVWAGVLGQGLYKSADGGTTWTEIVLPSATGHFGTAVLPSKAAADLVLVCEPFPSPSAIWRSTDAGGTFTGVLTNMTAACTTLADGNGGTIWAGVQMNMTNASALYKSTDGGATWSGPLDINSNRLVTAVVQMPSGRLVVGLRDGKNGLKDGATGAIYYSDDGGGSWTQATTAGGNAVFGIAFNGSNMLIALSTNNSQANTYTSTDGATWTAGTPLTGGDLGGAISYHAASDTFFMLDSNDRLLQSANAAGGYSFASATDKAAGTKSPVSLSVNHHASFVVDPANASHILLGDYSGGEGIFATTNGGTSWTIANAGLYAPEIDFGLKTASGHRYAANTSGFVYYSASTLGTTWTRLYRPNDITHDGVRALAVDTTNEGHVVIAQSNFNDYNTLRSLADATTATDDAPPYNHAGWQTLTYPDGSPGTPVVALLVDGMTIFAGTIHNNTATAGAYLYKSSNGGTSWTPTSLMIVGGVRALAFDPSNHQTIYAGGGDYNGDLGNVPNPGGLWKSTDGGATWTQLTSNATLNGESPRSIIVDPKNGMRVWLLADHQGVSTNNPDIFESVDGGATWSVITPSNMGASMFGFTYSPGEGLLAAATGAGVIVKTPANGSTIWNVAFAVYGEAHTLYAGSIGVGSGTGLYEATNVMPDLPMDMSVGGAGGNDAGGGGTGGIGGGGSGGGGGGMMQRRGGCGCGLVATSGAGWIVVLMAVAASLVTRRRRR